MRKKVALGMLLAGLLIALAGCAGTQSSTQNRAGDVQAATGAATIEASPDTPPVPAASRQAQGTPQAKAASGQAGTPQVNAQPDEWQTVEGMVISAITDLVEIKTPAGVISLEGRPLTYALEKRFRLKVGDAVAARGFDENGTFRLGEIKNLTSGASITLRDASGKPVWSGRGDGSGQGKGGG